METRSTKPGVDLWLQWAEGIRTLRAWHVSHALEARCLRKLSCPAVVVVVVVPAAVDGTAECCDGDVDDCFGGVASVGGLDSGSILGNSGGAHAPPGSRALVVAV
jgi:hypothetical protein